MYICQIFVVYCHYLSYPIGIVIIDVRFKFRLFSSQFFNAVLTRTRDYSKLEPQPLFAWNGKIFLEFGVLTNIAETKARDLIFNTTRPLMLS